MQTFVALLISCTSTSILLKMPITYSPLYRILLASRYHVAWLELDIQRNRQNLLSQLELHPSAKGEMLTKPTHL